MRAVLPLKRTIDTGRPGAQTSRHTTIAVQGNIHVGDSPEDSCVRSSPPMALLISPSQDEHDTLHALFIAEGWTLHSASSLGMASSLLRKTDVSVVITAADLPVGTWRDVLVVTRLLAKPLKVIVTSSYADERLWAEALNLGAYDVLAKPFDRAEVLRVLTAAWMRSGRPPGKALSARNKR